MASALRKLTGVGGDVRKIAALLQKKAPPGHKLAYINDEEAALLKARGGSGKPHADTGIPSFEDEYTGFDYAGPVEQTSTSDLPTVYYPSGASGRVFDADRIPPDPTISAPVSTDVAPLSPVAPVTVGAPTTQYQPEQTIYPGEMSQAPRIPSAAEAFELGKVIPSTTPTGAPKPEDSGKTLGMKDETLARLGLAGGLGLLGASTARKAAASGQAGAQQIQGLATPYQQKGAELQAQAQRGELTPAGQQSLQALQAQAAQAAQSRGGVGSQQTQAQVEAYRQQLLAQQYDYGLKLSGIGDNIALGAIKTGLEADRYVQQLNNSFYTNMAYIASGMSPGIRVGGNP
jgi:hypothetical protein